jgi:hypothetical protein
MLFDRARTRVLSAKPSIDTNRDIRITFFSKCNVVIDSSVLILMFCDKYLSNKSNRRIWKTIAGQYSLTAPAIKARTSIIDGLNQFNSIALFHLIFSSMESSIRLIAKTVFLSLYTQKSYTFEGLLKEILRKMRIGGYGKFTRLISLVRNTIHNNGVYSPTYRKDRRSRLLVQRNTQVTWNEKCYKFKINTPITFINTWSFELLITKEILKMMKEIIRYNKVILQQIIVDPFVL